MATTQPYAAVSGFAALVGINRESTYGSTASAGPQYILPVKSFSPAPENSLIKRDPVRRSSAPQQPGIGNYMVKGDIELRVDPVSVGNVFALVMGTEAVAASGGAYAHTYTLNTTTPRESCYVSLDSGKNSINEFLGCKFNTLDISQKAGDDLMLKSSFNGQTQVLVASASLTNTVTSILPFEWGQISLSTIDGNNLEMTDYSISLKQNDKPMWTAPGGRFTRNINELGSDVTGTFTVPYNSDYLNTLLWAGSSGPVQSAASTGHAININYTSPQTTGGVAYQCNFILNNVVISKVSEPISFGSEVMQQVSFYCAESAPGLADALKIILINSQSVTF